MVKHVYGLDPTQKDDKNVNVESKNIENNDSDNHTVVIPMKKIVIGVIVLFVVCLAIVVFGSTNFDSAGAKTSNDAVLNYVQAVYSDDDNDEWDYVPKNVRKLKLGAALQTGLPDLATNVTLSEILIEESESIKDSINSLENGFKLMYNKSISIDDAELILLSAHAVYDLEGETKANDVEFNVPAIKIGSKWYVYTGNDVFSVEEPDLIKEADTDPIGDDDQSFIESNVDTETTNVEEDDTVHAYSDVPNVQPYDGAAKDLIAGNVVIDDKKYVFPATYNDLSSLFVLEDSAIQRVDRSLSKNMILRYLPVKYVNEEYSSENLIVDIGNNSAKTIDVKDGTVTTLHIEHKVGESGPDVVLPGNVVFGTSFTAAKLVYGNNMVSCADNKDLLAMNYDAMDYGVYKLSNDSSNFVYLIFDKNNILVAVRWTYQNL